MIVSISVMETYKFFCKFQNNHSTVTAELLTSSPPRPGSAHSSSMPTFGLPGVWEIQDLPSLFLLSMLDSIMFLYAWLEYQRLGLKVGVWYLTTITHFRH